MDILSISIQFTALRVLVSALTLPSSPMQALMKSFDNNKLLGKNVTEICFFFWWKSWRDPPYILLTLEKNTKKKIRKNKIENRISKQF